MPRPSVLAALAVLALTGCGQDSPPLRPDLDQAVPSEVRPARGPGGQAILVFASAVDNVGAGPLVVEGGRAEDAPRMQADQAVEREDGSVTRRRGVGELRYVRSGDHSHWHYEGFQRYELRHAPDGRVVGRDRKTGFCLGDRYETDFAEQGPRKPPMPVFTEECGKGGVDLRELTQGLSVGYGDDYQPRLEGQYVDLQGVPPGRYVLVHRVNADRGLEESDYSNNAASMLLRLRAPRRPGGLPRVKPLAICPDRARCEPAQAPAR